MPTRPLVRYIWTNWRKPQPIRVNDGVRFIFLKGVIGEQDTTEEQGDPSDSFERSPIVVSIVAILLRVESCVPPSQSVCA